MKRAKIMLTAIAVFAVVGGALAFKAKRLERAWCTDSGPGTPCNVLISSTITTTIGAANGRLLPLFDNTCTYEVTCPPVRIITTV